MAKGAFSYLQRWMIIPPRFVVYMHTFGKADWMDDDLHVLPQMGHVLTSPPKKYLRLVMARDTKSSAMVQNSHGPDSPGDTGPLCHMDPYA